MPTYQCFLLGHLIQQVATIRSSLIQTSPPFCVIFAIEIVNTSESLLKLRINNLLINEQCTNYRVTAVDVPTYIGAGSVPTSIQGIQAPDSLTVEVVAHSNQQFTITAMDVSFQGTALFEIQIQQLISNRAFDYDDMMSRIITTITSPHTEIESSDTMTSSPGRTVQTNFCRSLLYNRESLYTTLRTAVIETPGFFNMGRSGRNIAVGLVLYTFLLIFLWFTPDLEMAIIYPNPPASGFPQTWPSEASAKFYNSSYSRPPSWFEGGNGWMVVIKKLEPGLGLCPIGNTQSVLGRWKAVSDSCIPLTDSTTFKLIDAENAAAGTSSKLAVGAADVRRAQPLLTTGSALLLVQLAVGFLVLVVAPRLLMSRQDYLREFNYTPYYRTCEWLWLAIFTICLALMCYADYLLYNHNELSGHIRAEAWSTTFFAGCDVRLYHGRGFAAMVVDIVLLSTFVLWLLARRVLSRHSAHRVALDSMVAVPQRDDAVICENRESDVQQQLQQAMLQQLRENNLSQDQRREFEYVPVTAASVMTVNDLLLNQTALE